jgi:uncharacterized protein YndB with AHSA1/START domain
LTASNGGGTCSPACRNTTLPARRGGGRHDPDRIDDPLIELEFEETDGVTTVRFTHRGMWDEEAVRSHEDGWGKLFDNLERTLEPARPER